MSDKAYEDVTVTFNASDLCSLVSALVNDALDIQDALKNLTHDTEEGVVAGHKVLARRRASLDCILRAVPSNYFMRQFLEEMRVLMVEAQ